jgi:polyisoprenoid-binding protein YceI
MKRALVSLAAALAAYFSLGSVAAQTAFTAKSGTIAFRVGTNVPFIKVAGSSDALSGSGEAEVDGNSAIVRNLRFEVNPVTLKTGNGLRDRHMYERVFTASDGTMPKIVLKAERFQARIDPQTSRSEGELNAQLTIRGVTRPAVFHVRAERRGDGAFVTADGAVRTSDFGVKPISNAGVTVRDEVRVTVTTLLTPR